MTMTDTAVQTFAQSENALVGQLVGFREPKKIQKEGQADRWVTSYKLLCGDELYNCQEWTAKPPSVAAIQQLQGKRVQFVFRSIRADNFGSRVVQRVDQPISFVGQLYT